MRFPERQTRLACRSTRWPVSIPLDLVDRSTASKRALHVNAQLVGRPSAVKIPRFSMLRVLRSRPGLLQAHPHAHSVTTG
jgi:hypothetical protein